MKPGDSIDIWEVDEALGTGGMGSVYKCHNRSAKRILAAIKVLETSLRRSEGAEARFIREAEILFTLDHPNIVKVRNIRTDLDPPYLEMEFVQGESLQELLREGPLSWEQALPLWRQLTDAVAYLHSRGVRHRDIKPANLLVQADGTLKLVDFGLAMEAGRSRLTQSNTTFGTVSYAPPEWISPDHMDPTKWDLYASGVVMWEMLRGEIAFPVSGRGNARQQAMQVIIAKQSYPPLDPGSAWRGEVRELIKSLTHPDPDRRPDSMAEVRDRVADLDPSPQPTVGETITPPASPEASTWVQDHPGIREDWAQALKATPAPADPKARLPGDSEAKTLLQEDGRTRRLAWIAAGGLVLLALVAIGAGLFVAQLAADPAAGAARAVDVVISGVDPGTPVEVRIGDRLPASRTSWVLRFPSVPVGDSTLVWTMGEGCPVQRCPGADCPPWCGTGTKRLAVEPGEEPQTFELPLEPPPRRPVRVVFAALDAPQALTAALGTRTRSRQATTLDMGRFAPGDHQLRVSVGRCTPESGEGCFPDGPCPPGCVTWNGRVVVPWGEGTHEIEIPVPAPTEAPAPSVPAATAAPPQPESADAGRGPAADGSADARTADTDPPTTALADEGSPGASKARPGTADPVPTAAPVTAAAYAEWLVGQPDWHPAAARQAGLADQEYLQGWTDLQPPDPSRAVRNVPWYAASAYCQDRGGLAPLAAAPLSWSESAAQPYLEWRSAEGKPAWRRADGVTSTRVRLHDASGFAGFRCSN